MRKRNAAYVLGLEVLFFAWIIIYTSLLYVCEQCSDEA